MVNTWDLNAGASVSQFSFNYKGRFLWTYNTDDTYFVIALTKEKEQVVLRLNLDDGTTNFCAKLPLVAKSRRSVYPTNDFVLYCDKRVLHLMPYDANEFTLNGPYSFHFNANYTGLKPESIMFNSVTIINDTVFAVMSTGRILYW